MFEKLLGDEKLTEQKKKSLELKLHNVKEYIKDLKPKVYDSTLTDIRGMEEQPSSPREAESRDKQDEQAEVEHLQGV